MSVESHTPVDSPTDLARGLLLRIDELTDDVVARIVTGDHAYAETRLLTHNQLRQSVYENIDAILATLTNSSPARLQAARATGRLKAEHGVPLVALLHAYRLGGRMIWERVIEEAGHQPTEWLAPMASDLWTLIDEFSSAAAEAYGSFSAEVSQRDARSRTLLLSSLLRGDVLDRARHVEVLRTLGLPDVGTFVVVSAEISEQGAEPLRGAEDRLRRHNIHSVWLVELDAQVGMLSLASPDELERVHTVLEELACARIGVSHIFTAAAGARNAVGEAKLAARCVEPGSGGVSRYGSAPIPMLVVHSPELSRVLADHILGPLFALHADECATLLETLSTWFACGGSATDTADRLHYHRNTIHHRLHRIEELTKRNCADPIASAELYVALQALRLVPSGNVTPASRLRFVD